MATFSLKYGDVCERCYKNQGIALREIRRAYRNYQGCDAFVATLTRYNKEKGEKELLLDISGDFVFVNKL